MTARAARFRVVWQDFKRHHDWIGRRPVRAGGTAKVRRKPPPPRQSRDFYTRSDAERFVAALRNDIGAAEVAAQIVALARRPRLPLPQDQLLPGSWPLARRGD